MQTKSVVGLVASLVLGIHLGIPAIAQITTVPDERVPEPAVPSRVLDRVDDSRLVRLSGNTHPMARPEFDRGQVEEQLNLERVLLVLKRSPEQEAALEKFMEQQNDPGSPNFHRWLEPEEFGRLYGPSDSDMLNITSWLQNQGLTVTNVNKGRTIVEFSGTAGVVQRAFHTQIHKYQVEGVNHIANSTDPSIPEALRPVVVGVMSLNDFFAKPLHKNLGNFKRNPLTGKWIPENPNVGTRPLYTVDNGGTQFELLSPYDFATIYNVLPLWNAGIDGTNQKVAIAGRSDVKLTDVEAFRTAFGLPANDPVITVNGPDPGIPSSGDVVENTLDVEWSGAVAKNATIEYVTTKSTATSDGASASALYIIDNKVAPVMSFSYGNCEMAYGTAGNAFNNSLWQQAAAQGITAFVASGDQAAAACDGGQTAPYGAENGLAVSGSSSTPYNVAVGGTDLNWANNPNTAYWNLTNATNGLSAKGYIPEVPWNGTCASDAVDKLIGADPTWDEETTCQQILILYNQQGTTYFTQFLNVVGGTGGISACTTPSGSTPQSCSGGYAKPSFQTALTPADGKRDVPDVSLFASSGALNTAYAICDTASGPCTYTNPTNALGQAVGGTSVASPAMAGIMALVNQKMGSAQGNANVAFYKLAAKDNRAACKSTTVAAGNACNFYDITTDNIATPCIVGDPNCTLHHTGDGVGILSGYTSATGYDYTTGLGTVNAANLVNNWASVVGTAAITLSPATLTFASTTQGSTSAAQTVTVKNTGTVAATLTSETLTGTNASSYLISANTCGASLAASASCTVSVEFKPAATGTLTAKLSVADSATGSPQTVALTGTGAAASTFTVSLSPVSLTFASTTVGSTTAAQSITVKNTGTGAVTLTSETITGTNATSFLKSATTCGATLAASATCTVSVEFKPAAAGALTASLSVADNATGSPQKVSLTGTGVVASTPTISLSPTSLTFASTNVGSTSAAQAVTLKNTSTGTVTLTSETITGANASSFLKSTTTCGATLAASATCTVSVEFKPAAAGAMTASLSIADNATGSPQLVTLSGTGASTSTPGALQFIPVTPCRIADTRNATGAFGGPQLAADSTRTFNIPQSACGIPATAVAYSLNATVVPIQPLSFLTMWPAGQVQPVVSTLNSDGRVKANATITPAGTSGGVSVFASDATQFILDIDGYFVPAGTSASGLQFFPLTPCRVADTRNATGPLGGPSPAANASRSFPVQSSACGIPSTAKAYSFNITAVPHGSLGFLTAWPTGQSQPVVSTLNSSTGAVTANAAIVPAGTGGAVSIFVSDAADVILDIDGYFAAPAAGGLSLYTVTPCRALDTRNGAGAFSATLTVPIHGSSCAPPTTAQAYVLNATVVPTGSLSYLTLWAAGKAQPGVSTLNANDGAVTSNMAIVPTNNGSVAAFSTDSTQLILDLSSYFAP